MSGGNDAGRHETPKHKETPMTKTTKTTATKTQKTAVKATKKTARVLCFKCGRDNGGRSYCRVPAACKRRVQALKAKKRAA
jgi:hypothetical protein